MQSPNRWQPVLDERSRTTEGQLPKTRLAGRFTPSSDYAPKVLFKPLQHLRVLNFTTRPIRNEMGCTSLLLGHAHLINSLLSNLARSTSSQGVGFTHLFWVSIIMNVIAIMIQPRSNSNGNPGTKNVFHLFSDFQISISRVNRSLRESVPPIRDIAD